MGQLLLIVVGVVLLAIVGLWIIGAILSLAWSLIWPLTLIAIGVGVGIWIAGRTRSRKG